MRSRAPCPPNNFTVFYQNITPPRPKISPLELNLSGLPREQANGAAWSTRARACQARLNQLAGIWSTGKCFRNPTDEKCWEYIFSLLEINCMLYNGFTLAINTHAIVSMCPCVIYALYGEPHPTSSGCTIIACQRGGPQSNMVVKSNVAYFDQKRHAS